MPGENIGERRFTIISITERLPRHQGRWGGGIRSPFNTRIGEPQSRSGRFVEETNILNLPLNEDGFLGLPDPSMAAIKLGSSNLNQSIS